MGSSSENDSLLKDTKDNILSLLVSSPNKVTVERLRIEYKQMIGTDIPYRRLGFDALISFLNCINDKVVVEGYDCRTAIVYPVVSKNTEQISKFVSRQRVPRKKGRGRGVVYPQRRMFPTPRGPSNLNVNARPFFFEPGRTTSYGHGSYPLPINRYSPIIHLPVFKPVPAFPYQLPTVTPKSYYSPTNIIPAGEWTSCNRQPIQQQKPQPTISNYTAPQNSTYRIPPPSITTVSSESNSTESVVPPGHSHTVPNTIFNNLKSLMKQHPKGIKCTMLAEVYLAQFGSVLDYEELGYESATKFTRDLSEIFHRERPVKNGDFILFDKTQEVPYSVLEEIRNEALQAEKNLLRPEDNTPEFSNVSLDELLISELYPDDVMTCHDFIPRLWSDAFVKGADLDIIVSEVYDPTKFWFQIRGEEFADKMNSIMDAMDLFYNEYKTEYLMPPLTIVKEQYVAAIYFDEWHRAVIVNKDDDLREAQCFFCDYGTVSRVAYDNLRFLHKKFSALAQQALRGRLDFITPIHATRFWPLAATELFVKTTTGKDLHCRVSAIDEEEWVVWMILTDRETPDVCCNEIFVNKRFATHDPVSLLPYKHILISQNQDSSEYNVIDIKKIMKQTYGKITCESTQRCDFDTASISSSILSTCGSTVQNSDVDDCDSDSSEIQSDSTLKDDSLKSGNASFDSVFKTTLNIHSDEDSLSVKRNLTNSNSSDSSGIVHHSMFDTLVNKRFLNKK